MPGEVFEVVPRLIPVLTGNSSDNTHKQKRLAVNPRTHGEQKVSY